MGDISKTHLNYMAELSGAQCQVFNVKSRDFEHASAFCRTCPHKGCDYAKTHLYGCYEAQRWDGRYIYYCPRGFIFTTVAVLNELRMVEYGVVAGPVQMGDPEDVEAVAGVPLFSTAKVQSLTEILHLVFSNPVKSGIGTADANTGMLLNAVYRALEEESSTPAYPITLERELQQAIVQGDAVQSKELLNRLLGHIFFHSNGDLEQIKSRVLELVVLLSRSAIEGGADADQIFALNSDYIKEVKGFDSLETLSLWLSEVINRFVSYVFDFANIKHIDIIYKTIAYIKENYMEKITLEDIAKNVYISKSYLSRLFKDEVHCSITSYIHKIRIDRSKALLEDDTLSLADVSILAGFEDQSYFTKIFKSITGVSPGKYREKIYITKGAETYGNSGGDQYIPAAGQGAQGEGTGGTGTGRGAGAAADPGRGADGGHGRDRRKV